MATEFDEKLKAHPLYALATEVGSYRLRATLKSQKAFDIELANMMKALEKQKEKLTPEQSKTYQKALDDIKKPQKQVSEQSKVQEEKEPVAQPENPLEKAPENNTPLTESNEEKGENKMAEEDKKDYNKMLQAKETYLVAATLADPKIDLTAYTATDEASLNAALDAIKAVLKERMSNEAQREKDMRDLADKPELKKEYESIEKEEKPRETMEVNQKEEQTEAPTDDLSWIENKRAFWEAYAAEKALTADFNAPEGETAPLYCKLSNGDKKEGAISYSSPNDIQITKESSLILYQGLVKDAVQNNLSITFGKTLDDRQKLMLYAAVLLSEDTYKDPKEKAQAVNPPALTEELMKPEVFDKLELPEEAKKALKAKYIADRVKKLRAVVKNPEAHLSPEELAQRKAKKDEIDKRNAARFGITPNYKTKYDHDVKDKDGKIIHKKGDERIVKKDENLFTEEGKLKNSYSQETFNALMKRKAELEGK